MPRGRFLSKSISLDEKVNALSDDTCRLLFTWLIAHLDCEGRLHGDPTTVKSIIFPRRKISERRIDKYLDEIAKKGLIFRYSINGNTYLSAPHFEKHQMGLQKSKEAQSQIPPPTPELVQSEANLTPPQVKAKVKAKVKEVLPQNELADFETFWKAYPKRKSKGDAERAFKKINPDKPFLIKVMLPSIEKAKKSDDWLKENGQYIPYPATWLNAKGWEDEIKEEGRHGKNKGHSQARRLPKTYKTVKQHFEGRDA